MSDNTYWGDVPTTFELIEPGSYTDNRGEPNEKHAIAMGEAIVQGSLEEWKDFMGELRDKIYAIEHPLEFTGGNVRFDDRQGILDAWKASRDAAAGDSNDEELARKQDLIDTLMAAAGIEVAS